MIAAALAALFAVPAVAQLMETFPDPLGGWNTRWLYMNSSMENYYIASSSNADPDYRGNNPEGLWIADTQGFGSGVGGAVCDVIFNPAFGMNMTSLSFGGEYFLQSRVTIYDMSNAVLATSVFSGGGFDFDHADIISANSANGISHFTIDTTEFGGGQVEGNTSVDNFEVNVVPEPATIAVVVFGLGALALRRRR
jgi:hypothetical protein